MASRPEGGGRDFFSAFGRPTRSPFSRRGLAFVLLLCCLQCVHFVVDNLRVLLAGLFFFVVCFVLLVSRCSSARPWFVIRELVVRWLAFLSLRGPASCLCSVLLCLSLVVLVALRSVVSFCSSARVARLSCFFL